MAKVNRNRIERSLSRVWKLEYLKQVMISCTEAGYDVEFVNTIDEGTITIRLVETDQIFLRALRHSVNKGNKSNWLVRYDQKLFNENYSE